MNCPHCRSTATSKRKHRTALGYRRFSCGSCHRRFNERSGTVGGAKLHPYLEGLTHRATLASVEAPSSDGGPDLVTCLLPV